MTQAIPTDIDADGDGSLSTDEYDAMVSQMGVSDALSAEDFFKEYDTNSDGEITADEIIAALNSATQSTTSQSSTTQSTAADNSSNDSASDDTTTSQNDEAQSLSAEYRNLAAKMMNAYEMNYEYMFGNSNTSTGSIA